MLNQNQSKKWNSWKYITVFPALVAFVFLFQIEIVAQEKEAPKQVNETKSENIKTVLHDIENTSDTILKKKTTITINKAKVGLPNNTLAQLDNKTNIQSVLKQEIDNKPLIVIDGVKQPSNFKIEEIPTDQIAKMDVLKGINATSKYGESGKNGVIEITTKEKNEKKEFESSNGVKVMGFKTIQDQEVYGWKTKTTDSLNVKQITPNRNINKALIIIDGKKTKKTVKDLDQNLIENINVLKDKFAEEKYGKEGKNGVIEITTKTKKEENNLKPIPQKKVIGFQILK